MPPYSYIKGERIHTKRNFKESVYYCQKWTPLRRNGDHKGNNTFFINASMNMLIRHLYRREDGVDWRLKGHIPKWSVPKCFFFFFFSSFIFNLPRVFVSTIYFYRNKLATLNKTNSPKAKEKGTRSRGEGGGGRRICPKHFFFFWRSSQEKRNLRGYNNLLSYLIALFFFLIGVYLLYLKAT